MLVSNPCVSDARVIREAEALAAAGHDITVLACAGGTEAPSETVNGVSYRRLTWRGTQRKRCATDAGAEEPRRARPLVGWLSRSKVDRFLPRGSLRRRVAYRCGRSAWLALMTGRWLLVRIVTPTVFVLCSHHLRFARAIERLQPDVIHAHDLYTLLAGWRGARRTGARLIYDSHELEMGRNGNYGAWHRATRRLSEGFLIKKTDAVIVVSDSIADHLAEHYRIARPVVVLNAPQERASGSTDSLRRRLGLAQDVPLCVSVGKTAINRGLDLAVRALALYPQAHLALVGPMDERVGEALRVLAADLGVAERLHFVEPVPHYQVVGFVASADVSLILVQNICLSYYMCFPNKLLESLLARLPVVAGRLVELERVVGETGAGVIVDENDPAAIAQGIREVVANRDRYRPDQKTLDFIRRKYGWDTQRDRLAALYESLRPAGEAAMPAARERSTVAS
ncbi:MAG: hypothetical protein Kow00114_01390 [Kiloniellaceae bacterium]